MSTRTEYPDFQNNQGKLLKVNPTETDVLWHDLQINELLPDQSGETGKSLNTDGTNVYWEDSVYTVTGNVVDNTDANNPVITAVESVTGNVVDNTDANNPVITAVESVTGLNTDNTDPQNPIVKVSVDGSTITGAGTPVDPLVVIGGGGGVDTRVYSFTNMRMLAPGTRTVYAGILGLTTNNSDESLVATNFGEAVSINRLATYISINTCDEDTTLMIRKNSADTSNFITIEAGYTGFKTIDFNEGYTDTDTFSLRLMMSGTATGEVMLGSPSAPGNPGLYIIVQTSTGSPLGVQSVTGTGVDNTDPFNPVMSSVDLTTAQTVAGIKTFSSFPVTPSSSPTTQYQVSNKKYVDDNLLALQNKILKVRTQSSTATLTPNTALATNEYIETQSVAINIANPGMNKGERIVIYIYDDGSAQAITFGTDYKAFVGNPLPTTTTVGKWTQIIIDKVDTNVVFVSSTVEA
jgi:hypothetical protein